MRGEIGRLVGMRVADRLGLGQHDTAERLADGSVELVETLAELQVAGAAADQGAEQAFALAARLPGYLVPRLVREIAGDPAKRPL